MPGDERTQTPRGGVNSGSADDREFDLLADGEMEILGLLPNASNYTFLTKVTRPASEGEPVLAVYKPRRGEQPLWDFPDGTLCRREVAAYEVSRALGWPSIPLTILRDGPEGEGAVQLFIEADPEEHFFTLQGPEHAEAFMRIALFDAVVNNADRKGGHCLLGANGRIWVVDHGVCFALEPKLRSVIWDFAGLPIPAELLTGIENLLTQITGKGLGLRLTELLAGDEVEATAERIRTLLAARTFPEPSGRAYPWPPV
jgi:uncharacterized repeat protein (TIGR03843 family)